jgi:hypothetical protein
MAKIGDIEAAHLDAKMSVRDLLKGFLRPVNGPRKKQIVNPATK